MCYAPSLSKDNLSPHSQFGAFGCAQGLKITCCVILPAAL